LCGRLFPQAALEAHVNSCLDDPARQVAPAQRPSVPPLPRNPRPTTQAAVAPTAAAAARTTTAAAAAPSLAPPAGPRAAAGSQAAPVAPALGRAEAQAECPICGQSFPQSLIEAHATACFEAQVERPGPSVPATVPAPVPEPARAAGYDRPPPAYDDSHYEEPYAAPPPSPPPAAPAVGLPPVLNLLEPEALGNLDEVARCPFCHEVFDVTALPDHVEQQHPARPAPAAGTSARTPTPTTRMTTTTGLEPPPSSNAIQGRRAVRAAAAQAATAPTTVSTFEEPARVSASPTLAPTPAAAFSSWATQTSAAAMPSPWGAAPTPALVPPAAAAAPYPASTPWPVPPVGTANNNPFMASPPRTNPFLDPELATTRQPPPLLAVAAPSLQDEDEAHAWLHRFPPVSALDTHLAVPTVATIPAMLAPTAPASATPWQTFGAATASPALSAGSSGGDVSPWGMASSGPAPVPTAADSASVAVPALAPSPVPAPALVAAPPTAPATAAPVAVTPSRGPLSTPAAPPEPVAPPATTAGAATGLAAPVGHLRARALYPYEPSHQDELSFAEGELLLLESERREGWLRAARRAHPAVWGLVPYNYVHVLGVDSELPEPTVRRSRGRVHPHGPADHSEGGRADGTGDRVRSRAAALPGWHVGRRGQ
jgi:hypothetical protein